MILTSGVVMATCKQCVYVCNLILKMHVEVNLPLGRYFIYDYYYVPKHTYYHCTIYNTIYTPPLTCIRCLNRGLSCSSHSLTWGKVV